MDTTTFIRRCGSRDPTAIFRPSACRPASALAHGRTPAAAYNLFTIEKDNAGWRCEQTVRSLGVGLQIGQIKHVRLI
ncbi:hypothetical protein ACVWZK_007754 [Bradyrhizobium sp. GM0.4]